MLPTENNMNPWNLDSMNEDSTSWNAIQNTMNYTSNGGRMEEMPDFVKSWLEKKDDVDWNVSTSNPTPTLTTLNNNTSYGALNFQGHQNMGELNFSTNFNEGVAQNPILTIPTPTFTNLTTTLNNNNKNGAITFQGHQNMGEFTFSSNFNEGVAQNSILTTPTPSIINNNNGVISMQGHQDMSQLNFTTNFNKGVHQNPIITTRTPTTFSDNNGATTLTNTVNNNGAMNIQGHQDMRQLSFPKNFNEGVHQNPNFTTHTPTTFSNNYGASTLTNNVNNNNNNNNGVMNIQGHQDMRQLSFPTNFNEGVHQNPNFTTHTPTTFIYNNGATTLTNNDNNNNNGVMNIQGHQDMSQLSFPTNFNEGVHQDPNFTTHTPTIFSNNNGATTLTRTVNSNNNNGAMNIHGHGGTNFNNSVDHNLFLQSTGSSAVSDTLSQVQNNYFLPPATPPNTNIIPNFNHVGSSLGTGGFDELNDQTQMGNGSTTNLRSQKQLPTADLYKRAETARNCLIRNNMSKSWLSPLNNNNVAPNGTQLTLSQKTGADERMLLAGNGVNSDVQIDQNLNIMDNMDSDSNEIIGENANKEATEEENKGNNKKSKKGKSVLSERRRRNKLDESLRRLRSVVPKITKLNKLSTLVDAINHIKEVKQKINNLQNELESTTYDDISTPTNANDDDLCPIPSGQQPATVDVIRTRGGRGVNIHMVCGLKTGLVRSTLTAIDSLGLDIQQAVITCFNDFVMDIFKAEQCKEGEEFPAEYMKTVILKSAHDASN